MYIYTYTHTHIYSILLLAAIIDIAISIKKTNRHKNGFEIFFQVCLLPVVLKFNSVIV